MEILLIVGSESGTAAMVADCVAEELEGRGHEVVRLEENTLDEAALETREVALICSATTGIGDLPQNVESLYDGLVASRPDLSRLRYGLIGLGDRSYKDSYLGAPKKWDAIFTELGARRVLDRLELEVIDNPTPDEDAVAWVPTWLDALGA